MKTNWIENEAKARYFKDVKEINKLLDDVIAYKADNGDADDIFGDYVDFNLLMMCRIVMSSLLSNLEHGWTNEMRLTYSDYIEAYLTSISKFEKKSGGRK